MTTGPGTGRVSTSEIVRALLNRAPTAPESSVTISTTAKHGTKDGGEPARLHTWDVTVRGEDADECDRIAKRIDDGLAAKYAHELDADTLAGKLAAALAAQERGEHGKQ